MRILSHKHGQLCLGIEPGVLVLAGRNFCAHSIHMPLDLYVFARSILSFISFVFCLIFTTCGVVSLCIALGSSPDARDPAWSCSCYAQQPVCSSGTSTDPPPASDDTPILSVVSPPTAADREQFYSSELYSTTGTAWSSAATGETNTSPAGT